MGSGLAGSASEVSVCVCVCESKSKCVCGKVKTLCTVLMCSPCIHSYESFFIREGYITKLVDLFIC